MWAVAFEFAPAAIFGAAVAFATGIWMAIPILDLTPLASGGAALGVVWLGLHSYGSAARSFPLTEFEEPPMEVELSSVSELLEQADVVAIVERLGSVQALESSQAGELELDDALPAVEPESRVIRLFEAIDTAGEMQARIDRHLRASPGQTRPDATQELHDALAALRRSLR